MSVDLVDSKLLSPADGSSEERQRREQTELNNTSTATVGDLADLSGDVEIILFSSDDAHGTAGQRDQDFEQWYLEGLNDKGEVVLSTQETPTADLASNSPSRIDNVGKYPIDGVVKVRARHAQLGEGVNSISADRAIFKFPGCVSEADTTNRRYELMISDTDWCFGVTHSSSFEQQSCTSSGEDLDTAATYLEELPVTGGFKLRSVVTGACLGRPDIGNVPRPVVPRLAEVPCDNALKFKWEADRLVTDGRCLQADYATSTEPQPVKGLGLLVTTCFPFAKAQNFYPTLIDSYPKVDLKLAASSGDRAPKLSFKSAESSTITTELSITNRGPNPTGSIIFQLFLPETAVLDAEPLLDAGLHCPASNVDAVNAGPLIVTTARRDWDGKGSPGEDELREIKLTCELPEPLKRYETVALLVSFELPNNAERTIGRFHAQVYATSSELDYSDNRVSINPLLPDDQNLDKILASDDSFQRWIANRLGVESVPSGYLCSDDPTFETISPRDFRVAAIVQRARSRSELTRGLTGEDYQFGNLVDNFNITTDSALADLIQACENSPSEDFTAERIRAQLGHLADIVDAPLLSSRKARYGHPVAGYLTPTERDAASKASAALEAVRQEEDAFFRDARYRDALIQLGLLANHDPDRLQLILDLADAGLDISTALKAAEFEAAGALRDYITQVRTVFKATDLGKPIQTSEFGDVEYTELVDALAVLEERDYRLYIEANQIGQYPKWATEFSSASLLTLQALTENFREMARLTYPVSAINGTPITGVGSSKSLALLSLHAWADLADGDIDASTTRAYLNLPEGSVSSAHTALGVVARDLIGNPDLLWRLQEPTANSDFVNNNLGDGSPAGFKNLLLDPWKDIPSARTYEVSSEQLAMFHLQLASYGPLRYAACRNATNRAACLSGEVPLRTTDDYRSLADYSPLPWQLKDYVNQLLQAGVPDQTTIEKVKDVLTAVSIVATVVILVPTGPGVTVAATVIAFAAEAALIAIDIKQGNAAEAAVNTVLTALDVAEIGDVANILADLGAQGRVTDQLGTMLLQNTLVRPLRSGKEVYSNIDNLDEYADALNRLDTAAVEFDGRYTVEALSGNKYAAELIDDGMPPSIAARSIKRLQEFNYPTAPDTGPDIASLLETTTHLARGYPQHVNSIFQGLPTTNRDEILRVSARVQQTMVEQPEVYEQLFKLVPAGDINLVDFDQFSRNLINTPPINQVPLSQALDWANQIRRGDNTLTETGARDLAARWYEGRYGLQPGTLDNVLETATPVQLDQIQAAAKRSLNEGRAEAGILACTVASFPTGTLVRMADGTLKPIEQIAPGEQVLTGDPNTGDWSPQAVLTKWSHRDTGPLATITLDDGTTVTGTDDHKIWVNSAGEWRPLAEVKPGDYLLTPNSVARVRATNTVDISDPTTVWELDTANTDTYLVHTGTTDLLVHNAGPFDPCLRFTEDQLGEQIGHGTNKKVQVLDLRPSFVVTRIADPDLADEAASLIDAEYRDLARLRASGILAVDVRRAQIGSDPALVMLRYSTDSKSFIKEVSPQQYEVTRIPAELTGRSLSDLGVIRERLEDGDIYISDLQFLVSKTGRVVVFDPAGVEFGSVVGDRYKANLRLVDKMIEATEAGIAEGGG